MTRDVTRGHFDSIANDYYRRNYEQPHSRHERGLALRRTACLAMLDADCETVLDLGSGPGALAVPLAVAGKRVVAFDLSAGMVMAARSMIEARGATASYCVGDAACLPFRDRAFDAVVTTGVLEYLPDAARAMSEVARVLRPGGVLIATVSLPRRLERVVARTMGSMLVRARGGRVDPPMFHRAFSPEELDALVASRAMTVEAREFSYFAPFPLDALLPSTVDDVDRRFGRRLQGSPMARRLAKTYIVKARRS